MTQLDDMGLPMPPMPAAIGDNSEAALRHVDRLAELSHEINARYEGVQRALKKTAEEMIEAGKLLIEAKGLVKHGQFKKWIKDNLNVPYRTAASWMSLSRDDDGAYHLYELHRETSSNYDNVYQGELDEDEVYEEGEEESAAALIAPDAEEPESPFLDQACKEVSAELSVRAPQRLLAIDKALKSSPTHEARAALEKESDSIVAELVRAKVKEIETRSKTKHTGPKIEMKTPEAVKDLPLATPTKKVLEKHHEEQTHPGKPYYTSAPTQFPVECMIDGVRAEDGSVYHNIVTLHIDDELQASIEKWRYSKSHDFRERGEAIRELIKRGLRGK